MNKLVKNRPAELGAFFVIAPSVYGWLVEVHTPNALAAIVGAVAGLIPAVISWVRDGFPEPGDPGDNVVTAPPVVAKGAAEKKGNGVH